MYAFSICIIEIVREKDKNKQKEAGIGPFLMLIVQWLWLSWQRGHFWNWTEAVQFESIY